MKLFQISEDDLRTLEEAIPELYWRLSPEAMNSRDVQEWGGMVKSILSAVRWNYGPPKEVSVIDAGEGIPE